MARAGSLFVNLGLESATFISGLGKANKETAKAMQSIRKSINLASGALAAFGASKLLGGLRDMADGWSDMSARVGLAVKDMGAAPAMMREIVGVADRTYSSLNDTAEAFIANRRALADMGFSVNETLQFTEALNSALVVSGAKGEQAANAQRALAKAMAIGRLDSKGLETVLSNGGRVAEALAEQLGTTVSGLRAMASAGKITGRVIADAMIGNLQQLQKEAEMMPATIGDGFLKIRDALQTVTGEFDKASNVSATLGAALSTFGRAMVDNIPAIVKGLQLATSAAIALATVMATKYAASFALAAGRMALLVAQTLIAIPGQVRVQMALGGVGVQAGIASVAVTRFAGALRLAGAALKTLGIGLVIGAVTFLVDKFMDLVRATGGIGAAFSAVWDTAKVFFDGLKDYATGAVDKIKAIGFSIAGIWNADARKKADELSVKAADSFAKGTARIVTAAKDMAAKVREGADMAAEGLAGMDDKTKDLTVSLGAAGDAAKEAAEKLKELRDAFASLRDALFPDEAKWNAYRANLKLIADAAAAGVQMEHSVQELQRAALGKVLDDLGVKELPLAIAAARDEMEKMALFTGASLDDIAASFQKVLADMEAPFQRMADFGKQIGQNLAQALVYGQGLGKALVSSIKAAVAEIMANKFARMLFGDGTALGGGGLVGGFLKGIGIKLPARAEGGPVAAGRMYLVGEKGPELMVPSSAGRIIANDNLGGMGGTTINIDARQATDPQAIASAVRLAIGASAQYTDGRFSRAMRVNLRTSPGAA